MVVAMTIQIQQSTEKEVMRIHDEVGNSIYKWKVVPLVAVIFILWCPQVVTQAIHENLQKRSTYHTQCVCEREYS